MTASIITVRYANGTYVARVKGYKQTASCVYDATLAAKSLARKLGLDQHNLELIKFEADHLKFKAKPLRRLPSHWKMVPALPTIAMVEAGQRAQAAGGTADEVFAAMLGQAPNPEAWPTSGSQSVRQEE